MSNNYYNTNNKKEFLSIKDIILTYSSYWKWFALSVIVCVVFSYIYYKSKDPIYNIQASIVIRTDKSSGGNMEASIMSAAGLDGMVSSSSTEDEVGTLRSQAIMRKMISELGLNTTYTLVKFPFDKGLYKNSPITVNYDKAINDTLSGYIQLKMKVKETEPSFIELFYNGKLKETYSVDQFPKLLDTDYGKFTLERAKSDMVKKGQDFELSISIVGLDFAAENYRSNIGISPASKRSNIIELSYDTPNRQLGKDILNKVIELYNEDALTDKNATATSSARFISEQIDVIAQDLDKIEQKLEEYKEANNITNLDLEAKTYMSLLSSVQEEEIAFEIKSNMINVIEDFMKNPKNKYSLIPTSLGFPETTLATLEQYNTLILERSHLLKNANESNPTVLEMNDRADVMRQNILASIKQTKKEIDQTKADWKTKERELQDKMRLIPAQEREYIILARQQAVTSQLYVFLLQKKSEAELKLASNTPKAKIIDSAFNIFQPVAPNKKAILFVGFIIGLCIPVSIIYVLKVFKQKLVNVSELKEYTNLPVLGEICLDKSGEKVVVKEGYASPTAELFRLLRANIQFLLNKNEKVILITSSISGEGKSFFALNLALSFSLIKGNKVVIVGLDIRNPKMTEYLGVKSKTGLTAYLSSDDMTMGDILIPLSDIHSNLSFVPAGPIPPNPAELLLRDRLDDFFQELRSQFDVILVDTAPVGMVSDTFTLNRISDLTLYLYRANYTNKSNLKIPEAIVKDKKLKNLSLVMNGTSTKSAYGYGYGVAKNK